MRQIVFSKIQLIIWPTFHLDIKVKHSRWEDSTFWNEEPHPSSLFSNWIFLRCRDNLSPATEKFFFIYYIFRSKRMWLRPNTRMVTESYNCKIRSKLHKYLEHWEALFLGSWLNLWPELDEPLFSRYLVMISVNHLFLTINRCPVFFSLFFFLKNTVHVSLTNPLFTFFPP